MKKGKMGLMVLALHGLLTVSGRSEAINADGRQSTNQAEAFQNAGLIVRSSSPTVGSLSAGHTETEPPSPVLGALTLAPMWTVTTSTPVGRDRQTEDVSVAYITGATPGALPGVQLSGGSTDALGLPDLHSSSDAEDQTRWRLAIAFAGCALCAAAALLRDWAMNLYDDCARKIQMRFRERRSSGAPIQPLVSHHSN